MGINNLKLKTSQSIGLDTNIFIYASSNSKEFGQVAENLLQKIKEVAPRVFISIITIEEFFVKVYEEGLEKETGSYLDFLTAGGLITVVNVNRDIALQAARLRAKYKIKTPDSLHLATAIVSGASIFITADKLLPKKKIKEIIVLGLN